VFDISTSNTGTAIGFAKAVFDSSNFSATNAARLKEKPENKITLA